jgi:hypothetical protein
MRTKAEVGQGLRIYEFSPQACLICCNGTACPSGSAWDQWSKSIPVNIVARTRRFVVLSQADLGRPVLVAKIFWFSHPPNHF